MDATHRGIFIYRASRLEALIDPLLTLMQASAPAHMLAPHNIIAAHPGMHKWLSRELAIRQGPRGIAANLLIELPSAFLDRLAQNVLGEEAVALRPYRREVLRWRIHDCLDGIDDQRVRAYLGGDESSRARRRFQLADRLARIYSQYLVYRPDWLDDWARTRASRPDGGFLAPLWKKLRDSIGVPHRGELLGRLASSLADAKESPLGEEALHVFGVAHLAPSELALLRAVAAHRPVVLYVPDPCREFWGVLPDARSALRDLVMSEPDSKNTETAFLEQDHPLLGSWGRMGQHFMLALDEIGATVDDRHWQDREKAAQQVDTRLHRVQESIRQLMPSLIREAADIKVARADRSLRVHACHTQLRELEALRDALLRARAEDPKLKPSDIIVMMPNIGAYVPLLPAVFGEAGKHEGPLPYHCADVAVARSHPLFEAFRQLLDLPLSRLTAPEVADLLEVPAIARRLNLGIDDIDVITGWLKDSRVAWGLDAAFRGRFDVPEIPEHTFAWAMDRMLAGYVMGQSDATKTVAVTLADGTELAPLDGIHGPQAALVGALDRLLVELGEWCADGAAELEASVWAERLEQRFESMFLIDPMDREAREAKASVLRFIRALASEPQECGLDPKLGFSVVREILLGRLDAVPERQRFLMGGITFCGMVPQRAIPFKLVAVLGLNDGDFPRANNDAGLDLMARYRRLGDRDVRSDDRYLFLETLMSAREMLHLSYIGQGAADGKPRNPAAPLAELMAALDRAEESARTSTNEALGEQKKRERPWLVKHPLQPFDERYFDQSDTALFSFNREFSEMRKPVGAHTAHAFVDRIACAAPPKTGGTIPLGEVLAFYKDPARQLLANALNLRLDALSQNRLRESEPLEAAFDALDQVARRLFLEAAMHEDPVLPEDPPDWLRLTGILPPGRIGTEAWRNETEKVQSLIGAARCSPLFADGLPQRKPLLIDCRIGRHEGADGYTVQGELRGVHEKNGALWVMEAYPSGFKDGKLKKKAESDLDFKARIGFFLEWALVRLSDVDGQRAVRACVVLDGRRDGWEAGFDAWDANFMDAVRARDSKTRMRMIGDLEARVSGLLAFWQRCQQHPQWYFPRTSWVAVGDDSEPAQAKWAGGFQVPGERDYSPGYARLLAGERDFSDEADYALLRENADRLRALITLIPGTERAA